MRYAPTNNETNLPPSCAHIHLLSSRPPAACYLSIEPVRRRDVRMPRKDPLSEAELNEAAREHIRQIGGRDRLLEKGRTALALHAGQMQQAKGAACGLIKAIAVRGQRVARVGARDSRPCYV